MLLANTALAGTRSNEPIKPIETVKVPPEQLAVVNLGKMLFFEPRLSKSGVISCNSCHNLATGGVDNLPGSIGHGWQVGDTNSPTVLNSRYNLAQFWDGRAKDLKEQAAGPIANPKEMAFTHKLAEKTLKSIPEYQRLFKEAFGTSKITIDRISQAIASFDETLVTPNSPFDQWLKGDDEAISVEVKKGYQLFKTKGCISCHNGPAVGGNMFQKFGLVRPWRNKEALGRFNVTKKEQDKYVFKVPTLRNIELTAPYFHDGSVWSLEQAIEIMAELQLGQKLTKAEVTAIKSFLISLTGEQPKVGIPTLPPRTAKTQLPVTKTKF